MSEQSYLEVIDKNQMSIEDTNNDLNQKVNNIHSKAIKKAIEQEQLSMFSDMFLEPAEIIQTINGSLESQSPFNKEIKVKIIESLNTKEETFLRISGKIYKDDIPLIQNLLNDFEILLNRK